MPHTSTPPHLPAAAKPTDDAELHAFLEEAHLEELELGHIDIFEQDPQPFWRWLRVASLVLGLLCTLLLPSSDFAQLHPDVANYVWWVGLMLTVLLGFGLWQDVSRQMAVMLDDNLLAEQEARLRTQRYNRQALEAPEALNASTAFALLVLLRPILILGGVATALALLFFLPQDGGLTSSRLSSSWYLAASAAIVLGIASSRLLMAQANKASAASRPRRRHAASPHMKWITLALIVGGFVTVFAGQRLERNPDTSSGFVWAFLGFSLGIAAAIWVARRFDEQENKPRRYWNLP